MSIIERLQIVDLRNARVSDFREPTAIIDTIKTGNVKPDTLDRHFEFSMQLKIAANFWANQAQYSESHKATEKVLINRVYGGLPVLIDEIRSAIYSGDAKLALEYCDIASKEMR